MSGRFFVSRLLKDTRGQTLFIVALGMTSFIGLAGLSLDLGNYYSALTVLQSSTNVAAIAGAAMLPDSDAAAAAVTMYSSMPGELNATPRLQQAVATPGYLCLTAVATNFGIACQNSIGTVVTPVNAIKVVQVATVPLWFGGMFGVPTWQAGVTATVSMRGLPTPTNIALVLDATLSQNALDPDCALGPTITEMQCELNGVLTFLSKIYPCKITLTTCTFTNGVAAQSVDRVALFSFPPFTVASAATNLCTSIPTAAGITAHGGLQTSGNWGSGGWFSDPVMGYYDSDASQAKVNGYYFQGPAATANNSGAWPFWPIGAPYPYVPVPLNQLGTSYAPGTGAGAVTYEVSLGLGSGDLNGFFSDYLPSDRTSGSISDLLPNSQIVILAGGLSGCGGMETPNYDGNYGTYLAAPIYAAQSALIAEQQANPGSLNKMVILSDGNADAGSGNVGTGFSSNGTYPSYKGDCAQEIAAAQYAVSQGTRVFTIAYGSPTVSGSGQNGQPFGCPTDVNFGSHSNITPCLAMQDMASSIGDFYTANQAGASNTCENATVPGNNSSIATIMGTIATNTQAPRLIPNGTQ
ncbi:MAG: pilus assembly protein TadG-related protein [Terracidiphilus sp.]|jgi:hypothetical protein